MDFPSDEELKAGPNALEGMDFSGLMEQVWDPDFRAGFVTIVGRPNAGKSTLTNALVGTKVAITSARPQTTRHAVRGVLHGENSQVVLVDTPGLHRPRTLLGKRLNDMVREALTNVDLIVFCTPADEPIGAGDRFIVNDLKDIKTPVMAVVTKIDKVSREELAVKLTAVAQLADFVEIVPVSATTHTQTELLIELFRERMPLSPPLFPTGEITDEPREVMIAEYVREAALEGVEQELPHSLAVQVDEMRLREGHTGKKPLYDIFVNVYVERPSQKSIIIGKGGARLREVGTRARREIEAYLDARVYLDLHVRVAKDWQRDPKMLGRLGF